MEGGKYDLVNYFRKLKELFVPDISAVINVNPEILKYLETYKVIYANCERIIGFFPLFLITPVLGTLFCIPNSKMFLLSNTLTVVAWILSFYTYFEIQGAKKEGEHELYRRQEFFTKLYSSFYSIWFSIVLLISCCTFRIYSDGLYFFFIQLIIGFVPLYRQKKYKFFIWSEVCGYAVIISIVYAFAGTERFMKSLENIGSKMLFASVFLLTIQLIVQKLLYRSYFLESVLHFVGYMDPLTNALNRRGCKYRLTELLTCYKDKEKIPMGIIMFDIDHFKVFNDTLGHEEGDLVLKKIVETVQEELKDNQILVRHGGEEFIVLLLNASVEDTKKVAWRIMEKVKMLQYPFPTSLCEQLSISIGTDHQIISHEDNDYEKYIQCVDEVLYHAKENGRNQICYSENMF